MFRHTVRIVRDVTYISFKFIGIPYQMVKAFTLPNSTFSAQQRVYTT